MHVSGDLVCYVLLWDGLRIRGSRVCMKRNGIHDWMGKTRKELRFSGGGEDKGQLASQRV